MPPGMTLWSTPDLVIAGLIVLLVVLVLRKN